MPARIGDRCVVLAPLRPAGRVRVGGEPRDARAQVGVIDAGAEAVVVGWDPFGLVVRPAADVPDPARLPNAGAACPSPAELAADREAAAEAVRRESFWANYGPVIGHRLTVVLPMTVVGAAAGWWWAGVPGVALGAAAAVLVAALLLAWLVLN
jgi:hypothetical protein